MTIRSSSQALHNQKFRRAQTLCSLFRVTRQDGFELLWTDHDRPIELEDETYTPALLGSLSAERREAGLRSGNQEAQGLIDGVVMVIPDLLGHKYRGAIVEQTIVDWRRPWVWHYYAYKRIRQMSYDGSRWIATLEGVSTRMQAPVGGRFGGQHSQQCTYTLADASTCKADITDDLQYAQTAVTVGSGSTAVVVNISGVSWTPDQWVGYWFVCTSGTERGKERLVIASGASSLTLKQPLDVGPPLSTTAWLGQGPRVATVPSQRMAFTLNAADFTAASYDSDYFRDGEIEWTVGANAGTVSPIVGYEQASATMRLLLPTAYDIAVNDRGIIRPGCDGLIGTCIGKFNNVVNFGGTDVYSPGANKTLEQPET